MSVLLALLYGCCLSNVSAGVLPVVTAPHYGVVASPAVITAQSHQTIARNFNHLYVPTSGYAAGYPAAYPGYATYPAGYPVAYPSVYRYGYAGYPYGYYPAYNYGSTWWRR